MAPLRLRLLSPIHHSHSLPSRSLTTTTRLSLPSAPGPSAPKSNATGLKPDSYGMKPGDDNTSSTPRDATTKTPNLEAKTDKVEVKPGDEDHPAKQPESQPEPTRGTEIKGKEEMG